VSTGVGPVAVVGAGVGAGWGRGATVVGAGAVVVGRGEGGCAVVGDGRGEGCAPPETTAAHLPDFPKLMSLFGVASSFSDSQSP